MSKLYRPNVGIVVFNSTGQVLLCERSDYANQWQFPQGGIEQGEDIIQAGKRELFEETGITSVQAVASLPAPLRYDFPAGVKFAHSNFKGQEQHWLLFRFNGNDKEINFSLNPQEIEFNNYQWTDISSAPKLVVDFKKEVYNKVVSYFQPLIRDFLRENNHGI